MADKLSQADVAHPWWEEKTLTKAQPKLDRLFRYYAGNDMSRQTAYQNYARLYTNRDILGNDYLRQYAAAFSLGSSEYSKVPLNVIKVMVDAVHARLTRPAIRVEFLPTGGNQSLRRKSRQLSQFVEAQAHSCNLRDVQDASMLDALVYGLGAIKTTPHPAMPRIENYRVHPRDIFVDPVEASANGKPSHLYHRQYVSRGKLAKIFPKKAKAIAEAGSMTERKSSDWADTMASSDLSTMGMVEVVEAYKLPSWKGSGDGKRAIFVDGACLLFEEWAEEDFPFSFCYWKKDPTVGFYGVALSEELIGLHYDINTSILHTERAIEAVPKPYILIPTDGEVNEGQLANVAGTFINYTGRAPQIIMPNSVPGDIVNYIETQWRRALQVARLVAMGMPESAGSQAETGQAFKDIVDIQSTELAPNFKYREDFCIRVAEQQVVAGKKLDKRERKAGRGGFKTVLRKDRNTVEAVEWGLIDDDPRSDSFVVQAQPASALSTTFGGRLAEVKEMVGLGMIPISRAFKLLDIPDLDSEMRVQNASLDYIERILEEILDEGKFTAPEPTMDLRLALKVTQKHINLAQAMAVEDSKVSMLYDFLRSVQDLIRQEQAATQMQAMGYQSAIAGAPNPMDITGAAPGAASLSGNVMGQI